MHCLTVLLALVASQLVYGVIELPVKRAHHSENGMTHLSGRSVPGQLEKRYLDSNVFNVLTWSIGMAYYMNVTVGTPPQRMTLILNTVSADTYVDAASAPDCLPSARTSSTACQGGIYNPSDSHTSTVLNASSSAFNVSYGDGSQAAGPLVTDVFGIGDVAISGVTFGSATYVNSTTGVSIGTLGLGYYNNEAVDLESAYPTVVDVMVKAGIINSRLYSLYLGSAESASGSIVFGGIDQSKYSGPLTTLNFLPAMHTNGQLDSDLRLPIVTITAAQVNIGGQNYTILSGGVDGINGYTDQNTLPVLLSGGSTSWGVPLLVYEQLLSSFPYVNNSTGICRCADVDDSTVVTLTFGAQTHISFNASQFIVPLINLTTHEPIPLDDGTDACIFLVSNLGNGPYYYASFGDSFLRNMYVVYDLDNGQASIAQAVLDEASAFDSQIVEVPAGSSRLANVVQDLVAAHSNTWSIPSPATDLYTLDYGVSTVASAIGTATGTAAIPLSAQVVGTVAGWSTTALDLGTPTVTPASGTGGGSGMPASAATSSSAADSCGGSGSYTGGLFGSLVGLILMML